MRHPAPRTTPAISTPTAIAPSERPTIFSHYSLVAENTRSTLPEGPNYQALVGEKLVARVIGIHNLALRPGVSAAAFEHFITSNIQRIADYPGWKFHMLKCQGGSRIDQHVVMLEIESLESLNAFHPELDVSTERALEFVREHQDAERMNEEWRELAPFAGAPQPYTDYLTPLLAMAVDWERSRPSRRQDLHLSELIIVGLGSWAYGMENRDEADR